MRKELQLFCNFLLTCKEILIVSISDIGKNTNCRQNNPLLFCHLARLRNTSFKDSHLIFGRKLPH